jgi:hypothetical protein
MSDNTFILVAGAAIVAAIWLDSRSKRATATATAGRTSTGQAYTTPTSVGEQLARGVVGLTLGLLSPQPKGVTTENARTAFRMSELQSERTATGWGGPSQSIVYTDDPNEKWNDANLSAPVYNPSTDLVHNPFALAAI